MAVGLIRGQYVRWALFAFGFALPGCPGAAELEDPERFELFKEPPAPTSCDQELPAALQSGCDYQRALTQQCASGGCHGSFQAGGLDLRVSGSLGPLLIARILNVPARHSINCTPGMTCVPAERTCDQCDRCPSGDLLVNRESPADSWVLKKMEPIVPGTTITTEMGCGDAMPPSFSPTWRSYTAADKACLIEFFEHVATSTPNPERFPCTPQVDGGTTDGGS